MHVHAFNDWETPDIIPGGEGGGGQFSRGANVGNSSLVLMPILSISSH